MAEASPGARPRPLSPHLQIWRWHVTMATSIAHRATGVALYGGALILAGWAVCLASGQAPYEKYMDLLASLPGEAVLFAITVLKALALMPSAGATKLPAAPEMTTSISP